MCRAIDNITHVGDVVELRAVVRYLKDVSGVTEEDRSCRQEATKSW
jgi:hypothetical protein